MEGRKEGRDGRKGWRERAEGKGGGKGWKERVEGKGGRAQKNTDLMDS